MASLMKKFTGPYEISTKINENNFVTEVDTEKTSKVNCDQLKLVYPKPAWIRSSRDLDKITDRRKAKC